LKYSTSEANRLDKSDFAWAIAPVQSQRVTRIGHESREKSFALQPALGQKDLFLTRLALPALETTLSTFFGGTGDDSGWGIALDSAGNPVVAGITCSNDLPDTSGAYQRVSGGKVDAFVAP
jgi:hypothetical protein